MIFYIKVYCVFYILLSTNFFFELTICPFLERKNPVKVIWWDSLELIKGKSGTGIVLRGKNCG